MNAPATETPAPREKVSACDKHGDFLATYIGTWADVERWSKCPACAADADLASKEEQRREQIDENLEAAAIPRRYWDAKFDPMASKAAQVAHGWLREVAASKSEGPLIAHGPPGTGKTYLVCAALEFWIQSSAGRRGRYMTAAGFCAAVRNTWGGRTEYSEKQVFDQAIGARLLILDDLGAGKHADLEILHELIDARYREGSIARTVVVTNVAPLNFSTAFGERIADRLRDRCTLVTMTGKSRRIPLERK